MNNLGLQFLNQVNSMALRRLMREGALLAVRAEEEVIPVSDFKDLKARIWELERLLGKKTMGVEIFKEAVALSRKETAIGRALVERSLCCMKTIAETLGISRSNLNKRPKGRAGYKKIEDEILIPLIRAICDARPTYGYRRVTAVVNRGRAKRGEPPITCGSIG